ncbi:MAG: DHH family phosphoesterase [Nitrospirae bacterium]|nr:DHH family phosphoesterase [Nitrospirota bacterium]
MPHLLRGVRNDPKDIQVLVPEHRHAAQLLDEGFQACQVDLASIDTFRSLKPGAGDIFVVELTDRERTQEVLRTLSEIFPQNQGLILQTDSTLEIQSPNGMNYLHVPIWDVFGHGVGRDLRRLRSRKKVQELRSTLEGLADFAILLHDNPDPDGIASAMAVRTIVGRTRSTAPTVTFAPITRPENLAMIKLLELEVRQVVPSDLEKFGGLVMVDVQPTYFAGRIKHVDAVLDHHPEQSDYTARFKDIRTSYGATSTILYEYLEALETPLQERLATAMYYALKVDTQKLGVHMSPADIRAFSGLFPVANKTTIRKIEQPELTREDFDSLVKALESKKVYKDMIFAYLGPVEREDTLAHLADLSLYLERIRWAVACGVLGDNLVVSIRNNGHVRSAGELAKLCFGEWGRAGGHRSMAKAIVPLPEFNQRFGKDVLKGVVKVIRAGLGFKGTTKPRNGEKVS